MKLVRDSAVDGVAVFRMMDSKGLPLEIMISKLAEERLTIDFMGFILAAVYSGNYTADRLARTIREAFDILSMPYRETEFEGKVNLVDSHYRSMDRLRLKVLIANYVKHGKTIPDV